MPRLTRFDSTAPGIRRIRRGRGFSYEEEDGTTISDSDVIERISQLAIPPARKEVWICPHPRGHIQATGYDDDRKQYIYHRQWREHRDCHKFDRMLEFARRLPKMREQLDEDLSLSGLQERRSLACAAKLLDLGFFRIGGERYAVENESYGLATMRRSHVRIEGRRALFDFPAKSGKRQVQEILKKRHGGASEQLFGYREGRQWRDLTSQAINEYLKELTGEEFTAKGFRTWNATVLAAVGVAAEADGATTKTARRRVANEAVKRVATEPAEFVDREAIERAVRRLLK